MPDVGRMNYWMVALALVLAVTSCSKTPDAPSAVRSVSPQEQLDQMLNADPGLVSTICAKTRHLRSVGWSDQEIPGLLAGGNLPPLLDEYQLEKLASVKVPTADALAFAIERC